MVSFRILILNKRQVSTWGSPWGGGGTFGGQGRIATDTTSAQVFQTLTSSLEGNEGEELGVTVLNPTISGLPPSPPVRYYSQGNTAFSRKKLSPLVGTWFA